jgi:hypothetical protein
MTTIKVQECGCIALPDEIVEQASLYPGSTLTIAIAPDGKTIQLTPSPPRRDQRIHHKARPAPEQNAGCPILCKTKGG